MTEIEASMSLKKNLGDYESFGASLSIRDTVRPDENTSQATDRVFKLVEKKLVEKIEKGMSDLGH